MVALMPTVLGVHLILVFVAIGQEGAAVAAAAPACTTFLNTDFNGHDLHASMGLETQARAAHFAKPRKAVDSGPSCQVGGCAT